MQKGDAAYIKNMNKQLVLTCIKDHAPISRSEISKKVNISKPTVSLLVDQLLKENWITETGPGQSSLSGGRKPVNLIFNPKAAYVVGVDIGGTKVASGIVDLDGRVYASREFPTQDFLNRSLFKRLHNDVAEMMKELNIRDQDILGMGIGVPGVTDVTQGLVIDAPALQWKYFSARENAEKYFNFPIYIENDVNTSVLGEHWLGAGQQKDNLIYIAIGTGIGSGLIINGQLYRGSNYSAGEMGYLVTDRELANHYHPVFEGYGFLESVASGSSIGNKLSKIKNRTITAKEAFELVKAGDPDARKVVETAIENLGLGIANYVSLFDPEIVILGGGVSGAFSEFKNQLDDILERFTPKKCKVVPSTFGKEAGVIGAVALFLKEYDSIFKI
ncbi:ROK family transcriptional regulator [Thalassobacillus devorans]|uniref:ROK family transcriptional regulator n=1 Tax=Thalassobacillus devorans TaxID=279813 RepID=UPI0004907856|nr:ROK family transcriptional regulator [Thalassobacillus devorans]